MARAFGTKPEKPVPQGSLLAASRRVTGETITKVGTSGESGWQGDAWDLYDLLGELASIADNLAGRVGAAKLYAGKINADDPTDKPEKAEADSAAAQVLKQINGLSQILKRQSVNLTIPGDGWIVGIPESLLAPEPADPTIYVSPDGEVETPTENLQWFSLSNYEVKREGKVIQLTIDDTDHKLNPDDVWLVRVWNPHPRKFKEATSSTRSNLPVLRELVGLTMHVSAQIDSRLAGAGLFVIASEARDAVLSQMSPEAVEALGEDPDPFSGPLLEAMQASIADRANASALMPVTAFVPLEYIEAGFKHISFANTLDKEAKNLREEAIRRVALGMNIPPEVLLGVSGMNHWGAWLVREDTITTYVEPQLALICDALTAQFLWPVLEQLGVPDFKDYVIWYDVDHLIARPNKLEDAVVLHQEGAISDAALRDAGGFTDGDAAVIETTDEAAAIVLKMVQANASLLRNPGIEILLSNIRSLLKGGTEAAVPPTKEIATVETPDEVVEGELVDEVGPPTQTPAMMAGGYRDERPINISVNVEPPDMRFDLNLPEGFTAAAAPPDVHIHNEPTPVEVYVAAPEAPVVNLTPDLHVNLPDGFTAAAPPPDVVVNNIMPEQAPPDVYVENRVETPAVTVTNDVHVPEGPAPTVNVAAPEVTVNSPPADVKVTVEPPKPRRRRSKVIRNKTTGLIDEVETTE